MLKIYKNYYNWKYFLKIIFIVCKFIKLIIIQEYILVDYIFYNIVKIFYFLVNIIKKIIFRKNNYFYLNFKFFLLINIIC